MSSANPADFFGDLTALREAARQLLAEGWFGPHDLLPAAFSSFSLPVDILDTGPTLLVRASLPGMQPEEVHVSIIGETLTLRGKPKEVGEEPGLAYLRRERRPLSFQRSIQLPMPVEADRAEATFQDGVLTLTLPKDESVRPKTIKIGVA